VEVLIKRIAHHAGAGVARVRAVVAGVRAVALMTDGIGATASSSASSSSSAVVEPLRGRLILAVLAVVRSRLVTSSFSLSSSSSLSLSLSFVAFASPSLASAGFRLLWVKAGRSKVSLLCFKSRNFLG
jgi:hypothetical protein